MEQNTYKFQNICEIITDYVANGSFKSLADNVQYSDDKDYARLIRLVDFNNNYDEKNAIWVPESSYNFLKKSVLYGEEIIISNVGANLGTVFKCPTLDYPMTLGPNSILVKTNDLCNQNYLYYYLKSKIGYNKLMALVSGSAMPKFNKTELRNMEVSLPNREYQDKAVELLIKIDKKIELNNKINNNLYELMKNKFDNFIDNLDRYEESVLSKIANYKNGLAMQKYRPINELGLPVIKIREMNSGISTETERCKSDIDDEVIINNGDVLFAWSGTLCMSIWCGGKAGLNQHIFKVTSDKYPKWFYYFWTLKHLNKFIEIAASKATTMGHIKRTELDKSTVKIPSDKSLEEADKIFTPLLNKYISNNIENRNLIQLRDTLLPKLMNGEIDLDNIEI